MAGAAFLCDCSPCRQPPHTCQFVALLATLFASHSPQPVGGKRGFEYLTSRSCSLNLVHTSVRSPFLKVSSFELFGSKFCFLLCPWLTEGVTWRRPNRSKVFRIIFYIPQLSRVLQLYSIISNHLPTNSTNTIFSPCSEKAEVYTYPPSSESMRAHFHIINQSEQFFI